MFERALISSKKLYIPIRRTQYKKEPYIPQKEPYIPSKET